jgi:hypothetical protein
MNVVYQSGTITLILRTFILYIILQETAFYKVPVLPSVEKYYCFVQMWTTDETCGAVQKHSSVSVATHYGLDGPGIVTPVGARFSALVQTGSGAHPASYTTSTGSFLRVKRPGRRRG